jgi:hypothetical protein
MVLSTDLDLAEIRFIPTRYWQWSNEPCAYCAMMPVAALQREWGNSVHPHSLVQPLKKADTSAAYPYGGINLIPALGIHFRIANSHTR